MNLQRITLKLFVDSPQPVPVDALLPIFSRWREDKEHPSQWVDMADYAHIDRGPGVMMIGQQGNLALDLAEPGPGILYANKKDLRGAPEERILDTFRRTLALTRTLRAEPEFPERLAPRPGFWQLLFNDRMETPNTEATEIALRPSIDAALDHLFGADNYTVVRESDSLRRYGFIIHNDSVTNLDQIAAKL
jgi:hypothetical protein